jgi:hypothetical protein
LTGPPSISESQQASESDAPSQTNKASASNRDCHASWPSHDQDSQALVDDIDAIFAVFTPSIERGTFSKQAKLHPDISKRTIFRWYQYWQEEPNWCPYRPMQEGNHRILSGKQERNIIALLDDSF